MTFSLSLSMSPILFSLIITIIIFSFIYFISQTKIHLSHHNFLSLKSFDSFPKISKNNMQKNSEHFLVLMFRKP